MIKCSVARQFGCTCEEFINKHTLGKKRNTKAKGLPINTFYLPI